MESNPSTGVKEKVNASSQFKNWRLQLHALNDATSREARGLSKFTGFDNKNNPIVQGELPNGGRGYKPNKKDPSNPKYNDSMNNYEVKFDKKTDKPYTAFPKK